MNMAKSDGRAYKNETVPININKVNVKKPPVK